MQYDTIYLAPYILQVISESWVCHKNPILLVESAWRLQCI